jgi:CubicO group peptidase (beta-lactamase class C family)
MQTTTPESVGLSSKRLNRLNDFAQSHIDAGHLPGTTTMVFRRGQLAHFQCHGKRSLETGEPINKDTIFRIYSMTKPITAVAAMILYERGAFDLNTPISHFIPEFKDTQVFAGGTAADYTTVRPDRPIQIKDLLSHTSGLTYDFMYQSPVDELYRNAEITLANKTRTSQEFVKSLAQMPLLFSPGSKWSYSLAKEVLGCIIEIISGKTLDVFFKEEIFDPLGMVDTDFHTPLDKQDRFATNYVHRVGMPEEERGKFPDTQLFPCDDPKTGAFSYPPVMCMGGGGLVSTASDYLKFATMLLNKGRVGKEHILSPKTLELMTTNHLPEDIHQFAFATGSDFILPGQGMGLGFGVTTSPIREGIIGSEGAFGWSGAAHTTFFVDPKEELIGIFLTQMFPPDYLLSIWREFRVAVYQSIVE